MLGGLVLACRRGVRGTVAIGARAVVRGRGRLLAVVVTRRRADGLAVVVVLALVVEDHPNGPLTDFLGKPRPLCHDPILSIDGASGKPGAIHTHLYKLWLETPKRAATSCTE